MANYRGPYKPQTREDLVGGTNQTLDYTGPNPQYAVPDADPNTFVEADDRPTTPLWKFIAAMAAGGTGGQLAANAFLPGAAAAYGAATGAPVAALGTATPAVATNSTLAGGTLGSGVSFGPGAASGGAGAGAGTASAAGGGTTAALKSVASAAGKKWSSPETLLALGQLGLGAAGAAFGGDPNQRTGYTGELAPPVQLKNLLQMLNDQYKAEKDAASAYQSTRPRTYAPGAEGY